MKFNAKMLTGSAITAVVDGTPYQVSETHPNYKMLLEAYKTGNADEFVELVNENKGVEIYVAKDSTGNPSGVTVQDGKVLYKGRELHNVLVDRILAFRQKGFPIDDMVKFLENLMQNPSSSSVNELFDFMENRNLPITENGTFIGYKAVRSDYWSKTAGKTVLTKGKVDEEGRIYNGVGEEIECERNQVDDNRDNECSNGLHVGGLNYATITFRNSGDKVVLVEVNPKDVVSVPRDYNAQKLRASAYKVIGEYTQPLDDVSTRDYYDEEEDYDYDDYNEYLEFEDLYEGQEVNFNYISEGLTKVRSCEVWRIDNDSFVGKLLPDDPSYLGLDVPEYRSFKWENCSEVEEL
jgi:hypothetical protein